MQHNQSELKLNDVIGLLAAGQLPELGKDILAEAERRWLREKAVEYSHEAQQAKIKKAEAKRLRRANKTLKQRYGQ